MRRSGECPQKICATLVLENVVRNLTNISNRVLIRIGNTHRNESNQNYASANDEKTTTTGKHLRWSLFENHIFTYNTQGIPNTFGPIGLVVCPYFSFMCHHGSDWPVVKAITAEVVSDYTT